MSNAVEFVPDDCRFFRIRAVAEMLGISEGHTYRIIASDALQAHRFGRATRVSLAAIRDYISATRYVAFGSQHQLFGEGERDLPNAPSRPPDDCLFYRLSEVAQLLQITQRHVHQLIKSKKMQCDHFGRAARMSLRALRDYLAATAISSRSSNKIPQVKSET
jgi:excisionase family DNA binding protein